MEHAWTVLREEARQSSEYLKKDLSGPLRVGVEGAGEGSADGSTRRLITTWLEDCRASILEKAL